MKKLFAYVTLFAMLLTLLVPLAAVSVGAEGAAAPKADLTISTKAEFLEFLTSTDNYAGKLVVLAADIDMEGERYDVVSRAFAGTFDGQGHTITRWWANNNVAHGIGLFGWVEPDTTATVKNLVILNSTFRDLKWQVGGIFGEVRGTVNIENIYSELNIGWDWAPGGDIGGFVGRVDHDKAVVNIKNCVYAGEINNKPGTQGHFAGFVGTINKPAAQVNITDSAYYGKMLESNTRNAGFVSAVKGILNIDRCVSAGTVNHSGKNAVYFSCKHYDGCAVNVTNSLYAAQPGYNAYTATGATKLAKSAFIGENATATIATNQFTETWSAAYGYMLPKSLNTMLGADFKGAGSPAFSGSHWYIMETADETPELLVIDSVEDLIQFSEALEHPDLNFEGLTVEIAADLDLNAGFDASARPATAPAKVWKLVSGGRTFAGTIDGKGHTISMPLRPTVQTITDCSALRQVQRSRICLWSIPMCRATDTAMAVCSVLFRAIARSKPFTRILTWSTIIPTPLQTATSALAVWSVRSR